MNVNLSKKHNENFLKYYFHPKELAFKELDSRFPHRQTSSGEGRPVHLKLHHPECRSPAGLRSESPALLSLHTWLCVLSQIHIYYQICWWYCGSGPFLQQWWDRILGWGGETYIMVPGQLSLSEREQNQRADCGLQKETPAEDHVTPRRWCRLSFSLRSLCQIFHDPVSKIWITLH